MANARYPLWNRDTPQAGILKHADGQSGQSLRNVNRAQIIAVIECRFPQAGQALRHLDRGKSSAPAESEVRNIRHAFGQGYGRKHIAVGKGS